LTVVPSSTSKQEDDPILPFFLNNVQLLVKHLKYGVATLIFSVVESWLTMQSSISSTLRGNYWRILEHVCSLLLTVLQA
jgi:hypothetical protein